MTDTATPGGLTRTPYEFLLSQADLEAAYSFRRFVSADPNLSTSIFLDHVLLEVRPDGYRITATDRYKAVFLDVKRDTGVSQPFGLLLSVYLLALLKKRYVTETPKRRAETWVSIMVTPQEDEDSPAVLKIRGVRTESDGQAFAPLYHEGRNYPAVYRLIPEGERLADELWGPGLYFDPSHLAEFGNLVLPSQVSTPAKKRQRGIRVQMTKPDPRPDSRVKPTLLITQATSIETEERLRGVVVTLDPHPVHFTE